VSFGPKGEVCKSGTSPYDDDRGRSGRVLLIVWSDSTRRSKTLRWVMVWSESIDGLRSSSVTEVTSLTACEAAVTSTLVEAVTDTGKGGRAGARVGESGGLRLEVRRVSLAGRRLASGV